MGQGNTPFPTAAELSPICEQLGLDQVLDRCVRVLYYMRALKMIFIT